MIVPLDEYDALRTGRGFVELAGWTSVAITGGDRQKFLNGFCTNNIVQLVPGQGCEAFITNVKGKVLGHGLVDCRENELVFITVPGQAATLVEHLDRYVIREDVQLRDTTGERAYFLAGPNLAAIEAAGSRWLDWKILGRRAGGVVEVAATNTTRLREALNAQHFTPCGIAAFEALRIEAGTPLFEIDFNSENLPQEVARNDAAISFTKGCYLGQETVARIDALGHVNQELRGVRFDATELPAIGTALTRGGEPAGHVTSVTFSPALETPLALAMLRRAFLAPGTKLDSPLGTCEVVRLPLAV